MFKRLFWLVAGIAFGITLAVMTQRRVRRYAPERVANDLADAVRGLGADLRAAVAEGREAMAEREAELRAKLDGGAAGQP